MGRKNAAEIIVTQVVLLEIMSFSCKEIADTFHNCRDVTRFFGEGRRTKHTQNGASEVANVPSRSTFKTFLWSLWSQNTVFNH